MIVKGGPGTGKTWVVMELLKCVPNVATLCLAPTARVARNIKGKTIHSALRLAWGHGSVLEELEKQNENETDLLKCIQDSAILKDQFDCVDNPLIVVIDEIAMIPYYLLYWVIRYFLDRTELPILVVGMGDGHQLLPVKSSHNIFGIDCLESHHVELTESKRFVKEYEPVIEHLRRFVDSGDDTGMFAYVCSRYPVQDEIVADTLRECTRVLAFRNATVNNYNKFYLDHMIPGKEIRLYKWDSKKKVADKSYFVAVKPGCRIYVTQNGCSSVTNGTCLVFEKYCSSEDALECRDDVRVYRNAYGKFPIALGFASTVHKFQGETIDDQAIAINFDGSRDLNLVYTALSRVRAMTQIKAVVL